MELDDLLDGLEEDLVDQEQVQAGDDPDAAPSEPIRAGNSASPRVTRFSSTVFPASSKVRYSIHSISS